MATAQTIIDVQNGKLSMTVLGDTFEFQHMSKPGATDSKAGLGVKKQAKEKKKPKPCPNKLPNPKPEFDDIGGCEKLQIQLLGYLNPMRGGLSRHKRITGHATDGVLDVY
ncbi:hypothetical protein ACOSQ3_021435 [Xanthoceras sorbifolium]